MKEIRFGELYDIPSSNGLSRPSSERGKGYKMVNMGELFANDIIYDIPMERVLMSKKELQKFVLQEDDLLFARQSIVAAGAGKCSIVGEQKEETTFESHLIRVRINKKIANPRYYFYLFQLAYNPVKTIVNQCAQAGIRGSELARIKVPFPSLDLQNKISSILSAYDELIENNNKRIKLLEKMAENLYKEWFVRFRFPGYEEESFKESLIGKIPQSFNVVKMKKVLLYYIGGGWGEDEKTATFSSASYVIRGTDFVDIQKGKWLQCPYRYHKESNFNSRKLNPWDIILEVSGGTQEQPVGRTLIVTPELIEYMSGKVICASFCKLLRCNEEVVSPLYFYYWMQYLYNTRIIDKFQLQSTGIINFKFEYFSRKGDIMIPSKKIMSEFEHKVKEIYKLKDSLAKQNQNLVKQRDLLLPRLMSGKLEV